MKYITLAAMLLIAPTALACGEHEMQDMDHSAHKAAAMSIAPSTKAYQKAAMSMHEDMEVTYTGNPDIDFIKGMIPHHQGAIDMAKVELKYGKDPKTKQLAADIIKAQEAEIKMMKDWLSKAGTK